MYSSDLGDELLYCFEPNSEDEDIRRLDCVFNQHCLGLAAELLGERRCLRRISRREITLSPPATRLLATREPRMPRPIIAVFMGSLLFQSDQLCGGNLRRDAADRMLAGDARIQV